MKTTHTNRQPTHGRQARVTTATSVLVTVITALIIAACGGQNAQTSPVPSDDSPPPATVAPVAEATATLVPSPEQATSTPAPAAPDDGSAAGAGCPVARDNSQLVVDTTDGICFLIPAGFEAERPGTTMVIYAPTTTPGHRERALIETTPVTDTTLASTAQSKVDEVLASLPGFTPTQSNLTVAGLEAIQLDNMPGQDLNRQLFVVANNRLYRMTFFPLEAERPDAFAEMETLYALMLSTLHVFSPENPRAVTDAASSYMPFLEWTGTIDGACYRMAVYPLEGEIVVSTGVCGDSPSVTVPLRNSETEWVAIQAHFGEINAETSTGTVIFQGQGTATGELWANALATWARFTAMETASGSASASARTTLAWSLGEIQGEQPGCVQLVVLAYGYGYTMFMPCEGGPATILGEGWLTDAELGTFSTWVTEGARVETKAGYLDAQGATALNVEEVTSWVQAVYDRLASGN